MPANVLMARIPGIGWIERGDAASVARYGRHEQLVELGDANTFDEAARLMDGMLTDFAHERIQTTLGIENLTTGRRPFLDFDEADFVQVPDPLTESPTYVSVEEITINSTKTGHATVTLALGDIVLTHEERLFQSHAKMQPGAASGKSAVPTRVALTGPRVLASSPMLGPGGWSDSIDSGSSASYGGSTGATGGNTRYVLDSNGDLFTFDSGTKVLTFVSSNGYGSYYPRAMTVRGDGHVISMVEDGTVFDYDPVANTWNYLAAAPTDTFGAGGYAYGKFYYVDGFTNYVYDVETNVWSTIAPTGTTLSSGGLGYNGSPNIVGARQRVWYFGDDGAYVYDPALDSWQVVIQWTEGSAICAVTVGNYIAVSIGTELVIVNPASGAIAETQESGFTDPILGLSAIDGTHVLALTYLDDDKIYTIGR